MSGAIAFIRSYFIALRASQGMGRANRLVRRRQPREALDTARQALALLHEPAVIRTNPAEAAAIVNLTILVESLAQQLHDAGADPSDLRDSLRALEELGDRDRTIREMRREWLPYLRERVQEAG